MNKNARAVLTATLAVGFLLAAGCATREATIPSMDEGVDIKVDLRLPEGEGPFPAVVLLHGCDGRLGSQASWNGLERHARFLNDHGIAALLVDSYADRSVTISESCGNPAQYVHPRTLDSLAALRFLQQDEGIVNDAIGVQGASQGAAVAMNAVSSDWLYDHYDVKPGFAAAIAWYPYCANRSPPVVPLLILIGAEDDWTPAHLCRQWVEERHADHTPRPQLVVLAGAHHSFDLPGVRRQQFQGHTVASDREAYLQAREHQRRFFVQHLVER